MARKAPAPMSERRFSLVPKRSGPGYEVAEVLGFVSDSPDEVKIRRWDSAPHIFGGQKFGSQTRVKRSQLIGDVNPDDSRMRAISVFVSQEIADWNAEKDEKAKKGAAK